LPENEDVSTLAAYSAGKTLQAVWSSSLRTAVPILEKHLFSVLGSPFAAAFCSLHMDVVGLRAMRESGLAGTCRAAVIVAIRSRRRF
jgi:hypothetical protein